LCIQVILILLPRMNHKNGNAEGSGGLGYEQGYEYIDKHRDIGVY